MATTGRPRQFDRNEALRKAMALFWRHGYEPTSLAHLKDAMGGISAASLYAAFGSKEALYREAIELYMASIGKEIRKALEDPELDPIEAVERALRSAAREQTRGTQPRGCMVVLSATNCSPENEHIQAAMKAERRRTRLAFRDCLLRAVQSGALDPETDVDSMSAFFSTLLNGISIQARDGASRDELNETIDLALVNLKLRMAA